MQTRTLVALATLMAMLLGGSLHPLPAAATTGTATIVTQHADRTCVGDSASLTWTRPGAIDDLTGYQIDQQVTTPAGVSFAAPISVGPEQTSLDFTVPFGLTFFAIRAVRSGQIDPGPYANAHVFGSRAPSPMNWSGFPGPADVGDGTATVTFRWPGPVTWSTTGGQSANTLEVTASPGGASFTAPASDGGVTTTFTGLTNGTSYAFTGVTYNACGRSGAVTSATYVPGVRPAWEQSGPPVAVKKNKLYTYQFAASGTPTPAYRLRDAPAWLSVSPDGLVSGEAPKDTTTFSFSVVAENEVGIQYPGLYPPVVAGPFTVAVFKGSPNP